MVKKQEEGRSSFIAGLLRRNQLIQWFWRNIFGCVIHMFYDIFYGLEVEQLIDVENPVDTLALRFMFLQRINQTLSEIKELYNTNHYMRKGIGHLIKCG